MSLLAEQILAILKTCPQGLAVRDLCARVNGTRLAISTMLVTLKELGKVRTDDDGRIFERRWYVADV